MGEEKRKFLRFDCLIPVDVSTPGKTHVLKRATVHDLSAEGLKLAINLDLKIGTPLDIQLFLPEKNLLTNVSGEVAWSKSTEDNIEVGLKIKKIDKKVKSELLDYLFPLWVEKKKRKKK